MLSPSTSLFFYTLMNSTGQFEHISEGNELWADQTEALIRRTAVIVDSNLRLTQLIQEKDREADKIRREVEEMRADMRKRRAVARELREEVGRLEVLLVREM